MCASLESSRPQQRSAMLLISVLACLTLVMVLFGAMMRTIAFERQKLRSQQDAAQAALLAESGIDRAAAQLAASADYAGETWHIDAEALSSRAAAVVVIRVETIPDEPSRRLVTAIADFPAVGPSRVRRSKEIRIALPKRGDAS